MFVYVDNVIFRFHWLPGHIIPIGNVTILRNPFTVLYDRVAITKSLPLQCAFLLLYSVTRSMTDRHERNGYIKKDAKIEFHT